MSAVLANREIKPRRPDWLADETVNGEPVSASGFPANRENNREFYENRAVWRNFARKNAAKSVSCRAIPYKMKQGINSLRTGKITGNFTKIGPFGETSPARTQQNQLVAGQFPTK